MITGRGPDAPGVTSGVEFTRGQVSAGHPGDGAVDLGEIRRSEEIIDVLAARVALPARMLPDPAALLLSALAADIDAGDTGPDAVAAPRPAALRPAAARHRRNAVGRTARAPVPRIGVWARVVAAGVVAAGAVAAGAVAAGVAGSTSFVAAGMLARLARGPGGDSRGSAPGWAAALRPRRTR